MSNLFLNDGSNIQKIVIHTGFEGVAGKDGKNGLGFKSAKIVNDDLILVKDDDSEINLGNVKGQKGEAGASIKGEKGDAFSYSDFTPIQLAALKGSSGADGADGADGNSIQSATIRNEHLILTFTDGTSIDVGNVKGTKGDRGDSVKGETGDAGRGIGSVSLNNRDLVITFSDGRSQTFKNFKPLDGRDGAKGLQGAKGVSIVNGEIRDGELYLGLSDGKRLDVGRVQGEKGDTGARGAPLTWADLTAQQKADLRGQTGQTGLRGLQGLAGRDGRSIIGANLVGQDLILSFSDGTKTNVGDVTGEDGRTPLMRGEWKQNTLYRSGDFVSWLDPATNKTAIYQAITHNTNQRPNNVFDWRLFFEIPVGTLPKLPSDAAQEEYFLGEINGKVEWRKIISSTSRKPLEIRINLSANKQSPIPIDEKYERFTLSYSRLANTGSNDEKVVSASINVDGVAYKFNAQDLASRTKTVSRSISKRKGKSDMLITGTVTTNKGNVFKSEKILQFNLVCWHGKRPNNILTSADLSKMTKDTVDYYPTNLDITGDSTLGYYYLAIIEQSGVPDHYNLNSFISLFKQPYKIDYGVDKLIVYRTYNMTLESSLNNLKAAQ